MSQTTTGSEQIKNNLLQLRQTIDDYRIQIDQHRVVGNSSLTPDEAAKMFYGPVSSFLAQAEPVLIENSTDGAIELFDKSHLGTVTVTPPPIEVSERAPGGLDPRADDIAAIRDRYADEIPEYELSKESDIPKPKTRDIHGIREILAKNGATAHWSVEITGRRVGSSMDRVGVGNLGRETTISNTHPWPVDVLYQAVRETTKALTNAGIGFKTTEYTPYDRMGEQ